MVSSVMKLRHRERSNTCPRWRRAHAGSDVQPTVSTSEVHVAPVYASHEVVLEPLGDDTLNANAIGQRRALEKKREHGRPVK